MKNLKYSEILAANQKIGLDLKAKEYSVGIISNITVNQLKEIFEFTLRSEGINASCSMGNYDNILQDSGQFKDKNLVVIFWELANIVEGLQYKAGLFDKNMVDDLVNKVKGELKFIFENLKETSRVVINSFSSLVFNANNIERNNFDTIAEELNAFLYENVPSNFNVIETDKIIANLSVDKSIDFRFFYSSKALYSIDFYKRWSEFVMPLIRSLNGKSKKALIFDCDNTLWKGILGEEGIDNILFSSTQQGGAPYEEVQSLAKQLISEGIILGLCSKNNASDVDEVLITHPNMTLKNEDLTIKKVNWTDKVTNLEEIAKTLNIGKDSLVFVDDSNFEINFVNESLPDIYTIQVPKMTSNYPRIIRENLGLFFNASKTTEDLKRVKMYKEQAKRDEAKVSFEDLESYIKSLDIKLTIHYDDDRIVPRMSQMTQKTNQFNLTTKRYTEADLQRFVELEDYLVIAIGISDKYGDNGITGLAIVEKNGTNAEIDTLLMSCRIIGRNIEVKYFDYIIELLKSKGIKKLSASYLKTLKNSQVENFYDKLGFKLTDEKEDIKSYTLDMETYKTHEINYMQINNGR